MNENGTCPIWRTPASEMKRASSVSLLASPRAGGEYWITNRTRDGLLALDEVQKSRLTSWLVEQRQLGEGCPEVTTQAVEDAKRRPPLSVHERADQLLRFVASELPHVAATFRLHAHAQSPDVARRLAWSECTRLEELQYLESFLASRGWIQGSRPGTVGRAAEYQVSVHGYARLAELERTATEASKAFVAMWFDESMDEVWENAIKPGIEDAGYEAVRIDKEEHAGKVDDAIIAELRRARFVVADFTQGKDGPRGGVYYEAGFAHGRDIPVVFSCREDAIEKVHFDTRQYNHIVWEAKNLDEFRDRLRTRISAVIGDGPRKK